MMLLMEPRQRGATGREGDLVLDNMTKQDEVLKAVEEPVGRASHGATGEEFWGLRNTQGKGPK